MMRSVISVPPPGRRAVEQGGVVARPAAGAELGFRAAIDVFEVGQTAVTGHLALGLEDDGSEAEPPFLVVILKASLQPLLRPLPGPGTGAVPHDLGVREQVGQGVKVDDVEMPQEDSFCLGDDHCVIDPPLPRAR